jgi:hypothetical protein
MLIQRDIQVVRNYIVGIVLMLTLTPIGLSQTTPVQAPAPASSDLQKEIIVEGKKTLRNLREELYTAEDNFFALFNSLNSSDAFDIECDFVVRIGSRRKDRLCMSKFARTQEAHATSAKIAENQWDSPTYEQEQTKKQEALLQKEMSALVSKHPELYEAFTKLAIAKQRFESRRR